MNAFQRRDEIVKLLQHQQRVSTRALSAWFHVSEVTIRNDLNILAEQGWVNRIHGGAAILPSLQSEQSFRARQQLYVAEKEAIARAAAALIHPGDSLLLDSSTTAYRLAWLLRDRAELRIVTNNLKAVALLSDNPDLDLVIIGGEYRSKTASTLGPMAREMLASLHVQKGFIGAGGLTAARGLTDADTREVEIKRAMVQASREVIIMLDSSKFGRQSFLTFATLDEIDHLVTDDDAPDEFTDVLASHAIQIHIGQNS